MIVRPGVVLVLVIVVTVGGVVAAVPGGNDAVEQRGGGDGGGGPRTPMGPGGPHGGANVSVSHHGPGHASVQVRNATADRTVRIRFGHAVEHPEAGLRFHEMAVTGGRDDFRLNVTTATRPGEGIDRPPGAPPFGYLNVTHTVPNANVTNASLTFALNRTRLRERNVTDADVALYRHRATNRTWRRLPTRMIDRNRTHVTYRADSPGLSEFAVAPGNATADTTPTATDTTPTATDTPTQTASPTATTRPADTSTSPTEGGGAGFGLLVGLIALFAAVALSRIG